MLLLGAACLLGAQSLTSCTDGFENANRPGNKIDGEEINRDSYAAGAFLIQLQNEAYPEQENTYQMNQDLIGNYLGRYMTYANDGFAEKNFALFNAPNGWVRYPFADSTPKVVSAFKEIERLTGGEGLNYAWALILRAQCFQRLSDMYGPFPIGAEDDANAYSSQETVYRSLMADLNKAIAILQPMVAADPNLSANEESDHVYGGNFANWLKYANSLKLRMPSVCALPTRRSPSSAARRLWPPVSSQATTRTSASPTRLTDSTRPPWNGATRAPAPTSTPT